MAAEVLPTRERDEILLRPWVKALAGLLFCVSARNFSGRSIGSFQHYPRQNGTPVS